MTGTTELRSIYSGPIRRALENLQRKVDNGDTSGNPIPAPGAYAKLVAVGSGLLPAPVIPADQWGNVTNPILLTTVAGHHYRIFFKLRAMSVPVSTHIRYRLSTDPGVTIGDAYVGYTTPEYTSLNTEWLYLSPGTSNSFQVQMMGVGGDLSVFTESDCYFYVEDLGVVTP